MDPCSSHTTGGATIRRPPHRYAVGCSRPFTPARIQIISPTPNEVTGPDVTAVLFTVK
jgi:hypothetical protein